MRAMRSQTDPTKRLNPIHVIAHELILSDDFCNINTFKIIKNIRSYYNFRKDEHELDIKSSIFSDQVKLFPIEYKKTQNSDQVVLEDEKLIEECVSLNSIIKKKKFVESLYEKPKNEDEKPKYCYESNILFF